MNTNTEKPPVDANALEAMAKANPDGKFLKGSGVLKLTGAIRMLEGTLAAKDAEIAECDALREKLADILSRTAIALKGPNPELGLHSWHDLPECALALTAERDTLAALAPPVADAEPVAAPADMFWNNEDAEQCHASIDDLLNNEWGTGSLEVGAEFEVQQAVRLPNVMIRVTAISEDDDEIMYEKIGTAAK